MRTCKTCGADESQTTFPSSRHKTCNQCRTKEDQLRYSGSPRDFLKRSLTVAQNRVKRGKVRFEITLDDVMDLWVKQSGKCAISGVCMTYHRGGGSKNDFNVSIDRIDSNGHYTTNNIQLVAHRANQMKNDMDKASFVWWVQTIYFNNCNF
jgi:uncharacterized protein YlxP (DUF503 family)